jgi:glycosyltransferase involved in cell wall biosynthesis
VSKILFISLNSPHDVSSGGNQRTRLLFEALKKNNVVDLLLIGNKDDYGDTTIKLLRENFNLIGIHSLSPYMAKGFLHKLRPISPYFIDRIASVFNTYRSDMMPDSILQKALNNICKTNKYDFIVTRYLRSACQSDAFLHAPVFVDIDDLDTDVLQGRLDTSERIGLKRLLIKRYIKSIKNNFPSIIIRCKGVWVSKHADLSKVNNPNIEILPNIPYQYLNKEIHYPLLFSKDKKIILGVGSLAHKPNKDGFNYFIRNIWPLVIKYSPKAVLQIIGSGLDKETECRWNAIPGVTVLGYVEDIRSYYQDASFSIAPIYTGGGTNIKVLESLAYGRACVCSTHAARGFEEVQGILLAETDSAFAECCLMLLNDNDKCIRLSKAGFDYVSNNYSYDKFIKAVNYLIGQ